MGWTSIFFHPCEFHWGGVCQDGWHETRNRLPTAIPLQRLSTSRGLPVEQLCSPHLAPLRGRDRVAGVLILYHREKNFFTKDHLRMLLAGSSKLGVSVENALQYERAQSTASTDFLTGLPNARSICLHLEKELSRVRRAKAPVAVLLCDLNGFKKVNVSTDRDPERRRNR